MGLLIVKTDFTGKYALAQSIQDQITAFISEYEVKYLSELLGADLYRLFAADVTNYAPVTAKYLTIFNAINEDYNGSVMYSRGMKKMLLGFIWFEYVSQTKYKHTSTGVVVDSNEVSRDADNSELFMYEMYNSSIDSYKTIQWYIQQHSTDYPNFNGVPKSLAWKL